MLRPRALFAHELRWSRTDRGEHPIGNLATVVSHPGPLPLLLLLHPGWIAALGIVLPILLRWLLARLVERRFGRAETAARPGLIGMWLRDLACFAVWLARPDRASRSNGAGSGLRCSAAAFWSRAGPMSARLIVTADDFGMSMEVNEAVEEAHRNGILTCASLVVAGDAAEDAVRRAKRLPGLGVGLHLAIFGARASAQRAFGRRARWRKPGLQPGAHRLGDHGDAGRRARRPGARLPRSSRPIARPGWSSAISTGTGTATSTPPCWPRRWKSACRWG